MSQSELFRLVYEHEKMMLLDAEGNLYENAIVNEYSQGDIIQLEDEQVRLLYNGCEHCGTIFITNHCNSSCVMCPDSDQYRNRKSDYNLERLLNFVSLLPEDVEALDITGGEPTLITYDLPVILHKLYENRYYVSAMLLSNGRSFADYHYAKLFQEFSQKGFYVEIPIHGSSAALHDKITRAEGGFYQTLTGIENLLRLGMKVGIRLVVSKLNYKDLENIVHLVGDRFSKIRYINIMGMECLGNAYSNREEVWIEFEDIKEVVEKTAEACVGLGIEPRLYNFPLCMFKEKYWGCYRKSITPAKVRYMEECEDCKIKQECGGFFHSTIHITKFRPESRGFNA